MTMPKKVWMSDCGGLQFASLRQIVERHGLEIVEEPAESVEANDVVVLGRPSEEALAPLIDSPSSPPVIALSDDPRLPTGGSGFVEYVDPGDPAKFDAALERSLAFRSVQLRDRDSQARLIRSERLATLGSMVAGLTHEIKTPLAAICGNNDVLEIAAGRIRERFEGLVSEHPELRSECEETCEIIDDTLRTNRMASDRLQKIVGGARSFARTDTEMQRIDLHGGIEDSLTLLDHRLKGRVQVVREFGDLPDYECYASQLNQVFLNLLVNAIEAIPEKGTIRVRTWVEGDEVRIAVSDDGTGMEEDIHKRVFEEGFTTKPPSQGTGQGLSISQQIVQNHGGRLEVDSKLGSGTTFTISLPRKMKSE